jgi:3-phenylpropionate/trans-cinnamate dioxygenase ferredoxin component
MTGFVRVATAAEIPAGRCKGVEVDGRPIAVINVDGTYYATDDTCTHRGALLSEGDLEGQEIICPLHGAVFDVTNGEVVEPPASDPLTCYNVRVSGNEIFVET